MITVGFFFTGVVADIAIDNYIRRRFKGVFDSLVAVYTVMLLLPLLFAAYGYIYAFDYRAIIYCLFFTVMAIVTLSDIYTLTVPDSMHVCIAILALIGIILDLQQLFLYLVGFFIISVPMLLIACFTGGFGGADIKLMAVAGLLLGSRLIVVAFLIAITIMGSAGIVLIIRNLLFKIPYKNRVPFCPALAMGCVSAVFFGDNLVDLYLRVVSFNV